LADRYSGTIFACATVAEDTIYLKDEDKLQHFKSNIFAPVDVIHLFENPLPKDELYELVKINKSGSTTSLFGNHFINIKNAFAKRNTLPYFLKNAYLEENGFYNIDDCNWISVACSHKS